MVAFSGLRQKLGQQVEVVSVASNSLLSFAFSAFSIRVAEESSRSHMRKSRRAPIKFVRRLGWLQRLPACALGGLGLSPV